MKSAGIITSDFLWDGVRDVPIRNGAIIFEGDTIREVVSLLKSQAQL
jgi:hypothetical protein